MRRTMAVSVAAPQGLTAPEAHNSCLWAEELTDNYRRGRVGGGVLWLRGPGSRAVPRGLPCAALEGLPSDPRFPDPAKDTALGG